MLGVGADCLVLLPGQEQENVLQRVMQLPVVSGTCECFQKTYASTKEAHPLVASVCNAYEKGVQGASSLAAWGMEPVVRRLSTQCESCWHPVAKLCLLCLSVCPVTWSLVCLLAACILPPANLTMTVRYRSLSLLLASKHLHPLGAEARDNSFLFPVEILPALIGTVNLISALSG